MPEFADRRIAKTGFPVRFANRNAHRLASETVVPHRLVLLPDALGVNAPVGLAVLKRVMIVLMK